MYACITDYEKVYNESYRTRRGEHTSFDFKILPPLISDYCRQKDCNRLLDVSGGKGGLADYLNASGIESITTDVSSAHGSSNIHFDLSSQSVAQTRQVIQAINPDRGTYLTTCFDVLEHIDREHLVNAVSNLRAITDRLLVVSISTRPSAYDNLLHATILPIQIWVSLFEARGFNLIESNAFHPATRLPSFPVLNELRLINRWATSDVFADISLGEPRYLIFEKTDNDDQYRGNSEIEKLVDVGYRSIKRQKFLTNNSVHYNLSLHHHQEWSFLRPFLDVIPRSQVRFLIRPDAVEHDSLRAIRGFLARCGVELIEYQDVRELPWSRMAGQVFITAAESSVGGGHLFGFELISIARVHGCKTFLCQHGVWPRAFNENIVTFASEYVLTWGTEDKRRLSEGQNRFLSADVPWGIFPDDQSFPIGSPKFCDQLIQPDMNIAASFGRNESQFKKVILVGSKDLRGRWGIEEFGSDFVRHINPFISNHPDFLFLIRPHPSDSAENFTSLPRSNTILFDNVTSILMDLPLSRVIPMVDLVVTSPSSLMVDAAVSSRPLLVYETGQPLEYDDIYVHRFDEISAMVGQGQELDTAKLNSKNIAKRYASSIDGEFYGRFSELANSVETRSLSQFSALAASLSLQLVACLRQSQAISGNVPNSKLFSSYKTNILINQSATDQREAYTSRSTISTLESKIILLLKDLDHATKLVESKGSHESSPFSIILRHVCRMRDIRSKLWNKASRKDR